MRRRSSGFPTVIFVFVVIGGFGALLLANAQPSVQVGGLPTQAPPTATANFLLPGFGNNTLPVPTIDIPTQAFTPPTLPPAQGPSPTPADAVDIGGGSGQTAVASGVRPTLPPTAIPATEEGQQVVNRPAEPTAAFRPPPLRPPISRDPLGRDHYWFGRPIDSNANNEVLFYYSYGSDGPQEESPWRVHHGIDLPNEIGETVRAAGSGTVIWASDGLRVEDGIFQNSAAYGNVVFIEHDFGYNGQPIYTLYAHLSGVLVQRGQRVEMGDAIGLVGESGRVSGPHVHFEVRVGGDRYASTYNPILWMVPYVGHGVIAGRVEGANGELLQDTDVTIRNWATNLQFSSTTTYIMPGTVDDVNPDPQWQENFAVADVPVGRYIAIVTINGQRVQRLVDVEEGRTAFVELSPPEPVTPSPTPSDG